MYQFLMKHMFEHAIVTNIKIFAVFNTVTYSYCGKVQFGEPVYGFAMHPLHGDDSMQHGMQPWPELQYN